MAAATDSYRNCIRGVFHRHLDRSLKQPQRPAWYGVFQIDATVCRDLPQAVSIALEPLGATSRLCVGDQARLRSPTTGPEPCRVRVLRRLTADQIAALPSRDRP